MNPHHTNATTVVETVERIRRQVDVLLWTGIVLGLLFTMANVQHFAAAGAPAFSLVWWAAWLLDPMVSLVLIAILRAEQITARHQVAVGPWVRRAKWATLAATYAMNTWTAWAGDTWGPVLLHSVPVMVVFLAAEALTDLNDKLTQASAQAFTTTTNTPFTDTPPTPFTNPAAPSVNTTSNTSTSVAAAVHEHHAGDVREPARSHERGRSRQKTGTVRITFDDYLNTARRERTPDTVVTPAWVREVTSCSRGLSSRLAATLLTEPAPPPTAPMLNGARTELVNAGEVRS
ncbi:hypothetical protein [Crossiella cryophila]|uniref:DUF2637 domain-containing protein n=1 Tax=Crossiella cryophila TaxID=43355 RepID=A0A7W7FVY2_9PSEU|nr:hypothetical protein [Crossiella cryophila]MBB4679475.1 hypothetical protein [Crossiella cryophila]